MSRAEISARYRSVDSTRTRPLSDDSRADLGGRGNYWRDTRARVRALDEFICQTRKCTDFYKVAILDSDTNICIMIDEYNKWIFRFP